MPSVFVIGGPNGAGKTTAARGMLPSFVGVSQFVNADEIARGLSGFAPESVAQEAGRIMLRRLGTLAAQRVDFAFETTLAARSLAPWLAQLQEAEFNVHIVFLWLPNPELAVQRVALRVKAGGHHVPEAVIRRRYARGRDNFLRLYAPLAEAWEVYDNSGFEPRLVAFGGRGEATTVLEAATWQCIDQHKV
jgi:predicted ABC-type ATPase